MIHGIDKTARFIHSKLMLQSQAQGRICVTSEGRQQLVYLHMVTSVYIFITVISSVTLRTCSEQQHLLQFIKNTYDDCVFSYLV